jgi:hypothetical protein
MHERRAVAGSGRVHSPAANTIANTIIIITIITITTTIINIIATTITISILHTFSLHALFTHTHTT